MNKQIKSFLIAVLLGTFSVNAQTAKANEINTSVLSASTTSNFAKYISKKGKKLNKKNEVAVGQYQKVLNMYHEAPVAFYNLSDAQKQSFITSSELLVAKLNNTRGTEAKVWAKNISVNKSVYEFIWKSQSKIDLNINSVNIPIVDNSITRL